MMLFWGEVKWGGYTPESPGNGDNFLVIATFN